MKNIIEIRNLSKSFGSHCVLDSVNFTIQEGEFLTIVGPSGCGKTTLLRLISGFEQPDEGDIIIGGQSVLDVSPQQRNVHTVFQRFALFPHMTVFQNIAFGLHCKKYDKALIEDRVFDALNKVKLNNLSHRKPVELSGGQQQRVAIARAIVNRPLVLLLDEPLSALDYRLRKSMQLELKQLQRNLGLTFILVTHDQEEALSLSDRVIVMHEGKIQQMGTPREVYEEPKNLTVAQFIGELNILPMNVQDYDPETEEATVSFSGQLRKLHLKKEKKPDTNKLHVLIRPEDIRVWRQNENLQETTLSTLGIDFQKINGDGYLSAVIDEVIYKGSTVDLMLRLDNQQILSATEFFNEDDENLFYSIGERVWVDWYPGWEVILPYEDEQSI